MPSAIYWLGYKLGVAAMDTGIGGLPPIPRKDSPNPNMAAGITTSTSSPDLNKIVSDTSPKPISKVPTKWQPAGANLQGPREVSGNFDAVKKIHEQASPNKPFNYARNDRTGQTISQVSPTVIKPSGRDPDEVQAELTADYNRKQLMRKQKTDADMQKMRQDMDARSQVAQQVSSGSRPATDLLAMRTQQPAAPVSTAAPTASMKIPAAAPPVPTDYGIKTLTDQNYFVNKDPKTPADLFQAAETSRNKLHEKQNQEDVARAAKDQAHWAAGAASRKSNFDKQYEAKRKQENERDALWSANEQQRISRSKGTGVSTGNKLLLADAGGERGQRMQNRLQSSLNWSRRSQDNNSKWMKYYANLEQRNKMKKASLG